MKKLIVLFLVSIVLFGCSNSDNEARDKLHEAKKLVAESSFEQAKTVLIDITEKYPETISAAEAANELAALGKPLPDKWDDIVKSTLVRFVDLTAEYSQKIGEAPTELKAFDETTPFPEVPSGVNVYYIRGVRHGLIFVFAENGATTHFYKNGKYQTEESRRTRDSFASQFVVEEEHKGVKRIMSKIKKASTAKS